MSESSASGTPSELSATVADLPGHVGLEFGPSPSVLVDQAMIDAFGRLTGDEGWIHCDVERARRELPWKSTIAHGYLLIALIPGLMNRLMAIRYNRAVNYGLNRVRFTSPVPAGSRVRLYAKVIEAEPVQEAGVRLVRACRLEIADAERPAVIAETVTIFYP